MVDPMSDARKHVWDCLEGSKSGTTGGHIFEAFIGILIVLNTLAVILESVSYIDERFGRLFDIFELFSIAVFTVEYATRVWSCVSDRRYARPVAGRIRFVLTPMAIIDLLAFLPFYTPWASVDLRFIRIFRVLRVFRIAKLARYAESLQLLRTVAKNRKDELLLSLAIVILLLIVTSSLMYYAENPAQPDKFSDIPAAMWWSVMTLTTVGYGDIFPVTEFGKILASITAMLGSAIFALPAALLGAGLVDELKKRGKGRHCPHCGREIS
jgi:voltage-gated potassium channel